MSTPSPRTTMLIRELHPEITTPTVDEPVIQFVASDESVDRYNEVIRADGWVLDNYRRNPVFLNAHQSGDILHTLGRAELTEVQDGKLIQRVRFAVDINPIARIAHGLYTGGFLRAVSVGFRPLEWADGKRNEPGPDRTYTRQELAEVSAVPVPANPNALAEGLESGHVRTDDVEETLELLRALARAPVQFTTPDPDGQADATAAGVNVASWLDTARMLEQSLRLKK